MERRSGRTTNVSAGPGVEPGPVRVGRLVNLDHDPQLREAVLLCRILLQFAESLVEPLEQRIHAVVVEIATIDYVQLWCVRATVIGPGGGRHIGKRCRHTGGGHDSHIQRLGLSFVQIEFVEVPARGRRRRSASRQIGGREE